MYEDNGMFINGTPDVEIKNMDPLCPPCYTRKRHAEVHLRGVKSEMMRMNGLRVRLLAFLGEQEDLGEIYDRKSRAFEEAEERYADVIQLIHVLLRQSAGRPLTMGEEQEIRDSFAAASRKTAECPYRISATLEDALENVRARVRKVEGEEGLQYAESEMAENYVYEM
jgi:hypothetical protein